jgi:CubicO group peptidase (beta-lactamase class C family)
MMNLRSVDQALRRATDTQQIPGVVAMAANDKEVVYQGAFGKRDLGKPDAMTVDSVFWIASMTKAITATAAMQLVEQGKLSLEEPIGKVLPDLAAPKVFDGLDAAGAPKLRAAKRPITLRHLMTHTAGYCYHIWNAQMLAYMDKTGVPGITTCENKALTVPLFQDPGERWEYGINIDFVGKAVEAASGKKLDAYLKDHIFASLGMTDTGFKIGAAQRARLVGVHARGADGALTPMPFELPQEPEFHMGGGGLYGTAPDYIKFIRMFLNSGSLNGNCVLKPETVAMMAQSQRHETADGHAAAVQRRRALSGARQEMGIELSHQHQTDRGGPQPRQPCLGRPCQYLFLDRSGAQDRRRHSDAALAVRRRESVGAVRRFGAWRLPKPRRQQGCGLI